MFSDVFGREHQLIRADPRAAGTYLACGLIMRGQAASVADLNRNLARLRPSLRMAHWAADGFKLGVCRQGLSCWLIYKWKRSSA